MIGQQRTSDDDDVDPGGSNQHHAGRSLGPDAVPAMAADTGPNASASSAPEQDLNRRTRVTHEGHVGPVVTVSSRGHL